LRNLFISKGFAFNKIKIIPQTVDIDRFTDIEMINENNAKIIITYMGSLNNRKDGILTLIRTMNTVKKKYPNIILYVIGGGSDKELKLIKNLTNKLELSNNINLIGWVDQINLPKYLFSSKILISCRPFSTQAKYGFPTKIVEYLASGKPVITTAYGDLKNYLKDGENAYIINENNPDRIAENIIYVLNNYSDALNVGKRGRESVIKYFNPSNQTKQILDFIEELKTHQHTKYYK